MASRKMPQDVAAIRSDIDAYRETVARQLTALEYISSAPPTQEELRARVEKVVDIAEANAREGWNPGLILNDDVEASFASAYKTNALGAVAMVNGRNAMVDFLIREASAAIVLSGLEPMAEAQKEAETERVTNAIFDAEVAEEILIRRALDDFGAEISRRTDIRNIEVVLATDDSLGGA